MRRIFIYSIYFFYVLYNIYNCDTNTVETHVEFHSEMGKKINLWAFLAARGKIDDGDVIIIKRHTGRRHRWKFCNITNGL